MFKREEGITLVALVVTIIVLLILAGVTLTLAIGDRGIFKMSQNAVAAYEGSSTNELTGLNETEDLMNDLYWNYSVKTKENP